MDDVTFGRNGREAGKGWLAALSVGDQLRARPGRSLMSMNACCICNENYYKLCLFCTHHTIYGNRAQARAHIVYVSIFLCCLFFLSGV